MPFCSLMAFPVAGYRHGGEDQSETSEDHSLNKTYEYLKPIEKDGEDPGNKEHDD